MAKWIILAAAVITAWMWAQKNTFRPKQPTNNIETETTVVPTKKAVATINFGQETYGVEWWMASKSANIDLIYNLENKKTSKQLMKESKCLAGINGGFYDTSNKPLGKFISNGKIIRNSIKSSLFNGYITRNTKGLVSIENDEPQEGMWILQTGPILIKNNKIQELALVQDRPARRSVAIETDDGMIMAIFFLPNSPLLGPTLGDLPKIIQATSLWGGNIVSAINLDGGSASAFYNENTSYEEFNAVGSWLCLK